VPAFALWAAALLVLRLAESARRARVPEVLDRIEPFVDLAAIVALTYTSGGPFSETAMAFFVLPVLAAARLSPGLTAGWTLVAVGAYIGLSLVHPTAGEEQATERLISQVAYLAFTGLAATLVAHVLHQRDLAIADLAEQRGQLAEHALSRAARAAADRSRRS
jgi:two-component system NarL family sensor kinase